LFDAQFLRINRGPRGEAVAATEAVEILINVKNLAEFLLDRKPDAEQDANRDVNEEAATTTER